MGKIIKMVKKEVKKSNLIAIKEYQDTPKEKDINRCRYCGKEIPDGMWWCNSIHRFWNQICGRTRKITTKN